MSLNQLSRRYVLAVGGVLASLGFVGTSPFGFLSDDDKTPGADGFTAGTVPVGSDPLVLVDVDRISRSSTAEAVTRTLLHARQFDDLPDALVGAFENESQSAVDTDTVGKLVLVGSDTAADSGGAVVWANWTDDELVDILESSSETDIRTESYKNRTLYTAGETNAAVLGDTEFALGTTEIVQRVVDIWHDDAEPVGGETLDSFERTPLRAHVRFSFEKLLLACDDMAASRSDVYDGITQVYGSVPATDDTVRLHLRVESNEIKSEVATAVRTDLGVTSGDGDENGFESDDRRLPRDAIEGVTVGHAHDFVTIEYNTEADEDDEFVSDVIETTVCLIGRSR